jgi:hypothetical protein
MWEQYKKTLIGMQLMIAVMTAVAYVLMYRNWQPAAVFFVAMQICAVGGAYWAMHLRKRVPPLR